MEGFPLSTRAQMVRIAKQSYLYSKDILSLKHAKP